MFRQPRKREIAQIGPVFLKYFADPGQAKQKRLIRAVDVGDEIVDPLLHARHDPGVVRRVADRRECPAFTDGHDPAEQNVEFAPNLRQILDSFSCKHRILELQMFDFRLRQGPLQAVRCGRRQTIKAKKHLSSQPHRLHGQQRDDHRNGNQHAARKKGVAAQFHLTLNLGQGFHLVTVISSNCQMLRE